MATSIILSSATSGAAPQIPAAQVSPLSPLANLQEANIIGPNAASAALAGGTSRGELLRIVLTLALIVLVVGFVMWRQR